MHNLKIMFVYWGSPAYVARYNKHSSLFMVAVMVVHTIYLRHYKQPDFTAVNWKILAIQNF